MSCSRRCSFWLATDGKWYMALGNHEYAYDDADCTIYGAFASHEAAAEYIRRHHSNPGGSDIDDSGTQPPPASPVEVA